MSFLSNFAQLGAIGSISESVLSGTYREEDIELLDVSGEGVVSGIFENYYPNTTIPHPYAGTTGFLTTRSIVKTIDLLGEGEIEGIVSGEYIPSGVNEEGQIGWDKVGFQPYHNLPHESWLRSVYLNDTPVVNSNGYYNYQKTEVAIANGMPSGLAPSDYFLSNDDGGGASAPLEKTRVINERLRGPDTGNDSSDFDYYPKVYRFLNRDVNRLRVNIKIPALSYMKVSNDPMLPEGDWPLDEIGETRGTRITFKYRYRPIYKDAQGNIDLNVSRHWIGQDVDGITPFTTRVRGIIRSPYLHKFTINLRTDLMTDDLVGWEVEIVRVTYDSIESHIVNQSFVDSITEVYTTRLCYPNSAIAGMTFNAEYFSSIPNRAFDLRLLKVEIPSNYDPIRRRYDPEPWDGEFKSEKYWTDNPAWVFYDLINNKRYGLGKFLAEEVKIDKWTLYEISKFCDVLVSDGNKGLEPRFTCNVSINTRAEAYKVLKDFASCFRSIMYYGLGRIQVAMDKPKTEVAQFNNSNVVNGNFTYSSSSQKNLATVCVVRYNDRENFYKPALEYVENTEGIRKYGVKEKEVTAFACTSRGQALRLGRWILSTELEQGESISFDGGPETALLRPGDLIRVTDHNRSVEKYTGRTSKAELRNVILDRELDLAENTSYSLSLSTPGYFYDESIVEIDDQDDFASFRRPQVQSFDFNTDNSDITISTVAITGLTEPSGTKIAYTGDMFSDTGYEITDKTTWSIVKAGEKSNNLFTIISAKENDASHTFGVEALFYNPNKYTYLESGVFYSYIQPPGGYTELPDAPPNVSLATDWHPLSERENTKQIIITTKPCGSSSAGSCDHGTTVGYKVYLKKGDAWSDQNDMVEAGGAIPKDEFLLNTVYLSDSTTDSNDNPQLIYLPPTNGKYVVRVFGINTVGALSSNHTPGKDAGNNEYIEVDSHFPVRDIKIHSLRLASDYVFNEVPETNITKETYNSSSDKDATLQWSAEFLNEAAINLPITYSFSVHEPSTTIYASTELTGLETPDPIYTFTFDQNRAMTNGPKRKYDVVVMAQDADGVTSSGIHNGTSFGWDIVQILNPKPTGFYLTPKRRNYSIVGPQQSCDDLWTDQYIDSDGFVHLDLLGSTYTDIVGGYAYVSKHPFSGKDFHADGRPKLPSERTNLVFGENEKFKSGEYVIDETNFENPGGAPFGYVDSKITFKPDVSGEFAPPYYMAIKLYDSFDKEINDQSLNETWNVGLLNDDTGPQEQENGLWLGFARDTTGSAGTITKQNHCLTSGSCGDYVGNPDIGLPTCNGTSGTFATPIFPTKYYSANQGGFKYWIRLNVNGQWEGQGISHVKVLSMKDVATLYNYRGFHEYACRSIEIPDYYNVDGDTSTPDVPVWRPNEANSFMRCKFRTANITFVESESPYEYIDYKSAFGGNTGFYLGGSAYVHKYGGEYTWTTTYYTNSTTYSLSYPAMYYMITGATLHNELTGFMQGSNDQIQLPTELSMAGVPIGYNRIENVDAPLKVGQGGSPTVYYTDVDETPSYNERGEAIDGKDRPLRGFRRFRVYFDDNNLPQPNDPDLLASYSVVGINSWNGAYEAWPASNDGLGFPVQTDADLEDSLLMAKDTFQVFPSSVRSYLSRGDIFENIPGVWNHHPAGFGQGFGGLVKTQKYFDIHLGRMIDDSYLNEGFFGVVTTNDYGISAQEARIPQTMQTLHKSVYYNSAYVTAPIADGGDGSGHWTEMY